MPDAAGIAEGFDRYRSALADLGAVDFDEQIYRAIEILVTDPGARATAQARCRRLLVDEFQDLTPAHLLMIRLLAAPGYDCFGVGDDDQVIYGYSGASPEFLIGFPRLLPRRRPSPARGQLPVPALGGGSGPPPALVQPPPPRQDHPRRPRVGRTARPSTSGPLAGAGPVAVPDRHRRRPGRAGRRDHHRVAGRRGRARATSPCWPGSTPPCSPSRWPAWRPASRAPRRSASRRSGRTGIRTAFAYLRIGSDPDHIRREDIRDTVRRPSRGIAPMVVDMLTKSRSTSIADIRRLAGRLSGRDVPKLLAYADDLETVAAAAGRSTAAALRAIGVGIGLNGTMDALDSSRREADRSTHADDLVALEAVAALHPEAATFEAWLRDVLDPAVGRGAGRAPVDRAPDQGQGVGPRDRLRGLGGALPPPACPTTRRGSAGSSTSPSPGPGPRWPCWPTPSPRRRSSASSTGRGPTGPRPPAGTAAAGSVSGRRDQRSTKRRKPAADEGGPAVELSVESATAERSLREWRSAVARKEAVPAYVVLTDKDLIGIATDLPRTLTELAGCRGIGPLRLERWGDEILAVLDGAAG